MTILYKINFLFRLLILFRSSVLKAPIICIFSWIARLLRSTPDNNPTTYCYPCSVKAIGLYLNPFISLLEMLNWRLQLSNSFLVNSNIKSLGNRSICLLAHSSSCSGRSLKLFYEYNPADPDSLPDSGGYRLYWRQADWQFTSPGLIPTRRR